ncbi:T6SS immunity protein Tli4 family protein [Cupriavidus agavae]|uniref:Tle cognate immunity protein 4 C-terminal domain-containing protein n=1 Tax=Cupriavidus agavae TaxID=1001822 RepID=A0A4Q7RCJ3_9BURK|nr:T6SS immunity protein Tli4 family protein [Cupriavidus agavae]RZT30861.1 hypothetical protein EV147_4709 [Cupriavidus agavae]
MNLDMRTRAIGRHLVDLPRDAIAIEEHSFNKVKIKVLGEIDSSAAYEKLLSERELSLSAARNERGDSMFVERVAHAKGSVTLISWKTTYSQLSYFFDSYFRAGDRIVSYAGGVTVDRRSSALATVEELADRWRQIPDGEIPTGIGFVVDDTILADNDMNPESWRMSIRLAGKPDVWLILQSFVQYDVEPGLRERAGGVLAGLLGSVTGLSRLRNRRRPVGSIEGDEILLASTQDGKRGYGFKWEAPGKARSLAEPQINVSLRVGESAYTTNAESFASDEEALALWDAVIDSIRLRPGAV